MKKMKNLLCMLCALVFTFVLASCGNKSGVKVEEEHVASATKIVFTLTFAKNDNLTEGTAIPHMKRYAYDEKADDKAGDFQQNAACLLNDSKTTGTISFTGLKADTQYTFRLYITFSEDEELLGTYVVKTSKNTDESSAVKITSVEGFKEMNDDPEGYYVLENDIDFNGEELTAMFSSTGNQFKGHFDGKGYAIKNFTFASGVLGMFGYTKDATIKNLNIIGTTSEYKASHENQDLVNADYSTGRTTANLAILAANAENTMFENITISNVKTQIKGNASAEINVGTVVGKSDGCAFKNVNVTASSIEFVQLRLKVSAGLFAGMISGESSFKGEDGKNYSCEACSASGSVTGELYYPQAEGFAYVGGFAGSIGTSARIRNCYSDAVIEITRSEVTSDANKFNLAVGGFVGCKNGSTMNVSNCAAIADIAVYAGKKDTDTETLLGRKLTANTCLVGGFAGNIVEYVNKIENCCYVQKSEGVKVVAREKDEVEDEGGTPVVTYLYTKSLTVARIYDETRLVNVFAYDGTQDLSIFAENIKNVILAQTK